MTDLQSLWFFVPAVIANLVLVTVVNLTAFAVVREREIGTLEQIMVTPIRRLEFILGKPFLSSLSVFSKHLWGATNHILLVRAREEGRTAGTAALTTVVVPLDGSALAEKPLPYVVDLAKKMKLKVVLARILAAAYCRRCIRNLYGGADQSS